MKNLSLFKMTLLIVAMSCATQASDSDPIQTTSPNDEQLGPYPSITPGEISTSDKPDPWNCGYEWIIVKGPNGETIVSEIPLKCDPFADMYTGDPAPYNDKIIKEKNK